MLTAAAIIQKVGSIMAVVSLLPWIYAPGIAKHPPLDSTVWLSRTGTKYHYTNECSNMKDPLPVSLLEALDAGRTPCKNCY